MMDQTVHVYILHPLFLWYTFSVGPLTLRNKPGHSLTHTLTAAMFFSPYSFLTELSFNPQWNTFGSEYSQMTDWTTGVSGLRREIWLDLFTRAPHCFHMGSTSSTHLGGGWGWGGWLSVLLICSSFNKWRHAVGRKRDLELQMSAYKTWNVFCTQNHPPPLICLALQAEMCLKMQHCNTASSQMWVNLWPYSSMLNFPQHSFIFRVAFSFYFCWRAMQ